MNAPTLNEFSEFGGVQPDAAALAKLFAFHGIRSPATDKPLSEAICFGLLGGIAAGYSFCPSIPGYGAGSGVALVGRHHMFNTDGKLQSAAIARVGGKPLMAESASPKKAQQQLAEVLASGSPAILWCSSLAFPHIGWASSCGMTTTLIYRLDEDQERAWLADTANVPLEQSLVELAEMRGQVCSHKNRLMTLKPPKQLTKAQLNRGIREAIRSCADDFLKPKIGSFNLPGLQTLAKMMPNDRNRKAGWLSVFPEGKVYLALRDAYASIELVGNGGLLRELYADFLDEASVVTGRRGLLTCAASYRELGKAWSDLASLLLPSKINSFKKTRDLLGRRVELYRQKGFKAKKQIGGIVDKLLQLESETVENFPWDDTATKTWLEDLSHQVVELHDRELAAAKQLLAAVK